MAEMIDTSVKGWQKKLEECMRQNKKALIVTKDEELAHALVERNLKGRHIGLLFLGAGATDVAGVGGVTAVAVAAAIAAISDPEPLSKSALAVIAGALFALGAYWVYRLIKMLVEKKYKFKMKRKKGGEIVIEGEPAAA
jgi:hypothetical protein